MIPAFLVKGAIRLGIGIILNTGDKAISIALAKKSNPEITYIYPKKKEKTINKNLTNILNIIYSILYFVPILGTIELVIDFLLVSIHGAVYIAGEKVPFLKKEIKKQKLDINTETPNERLKKLEKGEKLYKDITDSLKLEGLPEKEIKEEIKKAQEADPYIRKNNQEEIEESIRRTNNLQLLEEMKDYLLSPEKAYEFTSKGNRRIEYADVENDTLTIGVSSSKQDENPKILKKKFKLIPSEEEDY